MASRAIYTRIAIDGYRISSETNKATVKLDADKTEITCFEDTAKSYIVNDPKPGIELGGYLTASTDPDTFEAISHGALSVPVTVSVVKASTSAITGGVSYTIPNANAITLSHDLQVAGVMTMQASWGGADAMVRGKCVYGGAALAATGATAAVDVGAQGTAGGIAYLHVTAITGSATNAAIKLQSSATQGGTYADEGTWTFSAIGVYPVDLSGTVDRWLRINVTSLGGATDVTVTVLGVVYGVTNPTPAA